MGSHAAVAATLLEDQALVDAVLADYRTAPIDESWKVLFDFLGTVNDRCAEVGPPDIETVKAAGWSEEAIYDAQIVPFVTRHVAPHATRVAAQFAVLTRMRAEPVATQAARALGDDVEAAIDAAGEIRKELGR